MTTRPSARTTFRIEVAQADLDDLQQRRDRVRRPNVVDEDDETHGIPVSLVRRLVDHRRTGCDRRRHEADLNGLGHAVRRVRGLDVHRGAGAWLVDEHRAWSDREPDPDQVVPHVSPDRHTSSIRSAMRLHSEGLGEWDGPPHRSGSAGAGPSGPLAVPTAFALVPRDVVVPPRAFAERFSPVERYTLLPRGGHVGALEEPDLLADDLVAFLAALPA